MKRVLLILLALALPSAAVAGGCRIVQRAAVVQEVAVVQAAIVTPFVPSVAVFAVPAYGASYAPAYAPPAVQAAPQVAPCADKLDAILRRLDNIERTPRSSGTVAPAVKPPIMPPAEASLEPVRALFAARCVSCHESTVAQAKGKGLILLAGDQLAALTDSQKLKVLTAIYTGSMPPKGGPLADADVSKVAEAFASR